MSDITTVIHESVAYQIDMGTNLTLIKANVNRENAKVPSVRKPRLLLGKATVKIFTQLYICKRC